MLKTVSSITNAIGALNYVGTWNASTNTPTITSSVGTKGDYYQVSVAGSTSINGISNWGVGDVIAFNGSTWQRIEGGADLNGVNLSVSGTSTLGSLNGLGTATPESPLSLASSFKRDGSAGSSFDVYIPISVMTVKDADAATLAVGTDNANSSLTLAAGTDISIANVGIVRTEAGSQATYATSVLKQAPTGYSTAVRIIIVGDEDTTGDASATTVLMRQSINNGTSWTDWEFRTSYFHNFWGQRYVIVGPWQALNTLDDNIPAIMKMGVRAASAKALRYSKIMIMHAYVKI